MQRIDLERDRVIVQISRSSYTRVRKTYMSERIGDRPRLVNPRAASRAKTGGQPLR